MHRVTKRLALVCGECSAFGGEDGRGEEPSETRRWERRGPWPGFRKDSGAPWSQSEEVGACSYSVE